LIFFYSAGVVDGDDPACDFGFFSADDDRRECGIARDQDDVRAPVPDVPYHADAAPRGADPDGGDIPGFNRP
jgi:hypothetical protein